MPPDLPTPRGRPSVEHYTDGSMIGILAAGVLFAGGLLAIFLFTRPPSKQTASNQPMNLEAINKGPPVSR